MTQRERESESEREREREREGERERERRERERERERDVAVICDYYCTVAQQCVQAHLKSCFYFIYDSKTAVCVLLYASNTHSNHTQSHTTHSHTQSFTHKYIYTHAQKQLQDVQFIEVQLPVRIGQLMEMGPKVEFRDTPQGQGKITLQQWEMCVCACVRVCVCACVCMCECVCSRFRTILWMQKTTVTIL